MRRARIVETIGAGLLAVGIIVAPVVGVTPVSTAEAAPVTVLAEDFEDGAWAPLVQSGGPTLSVIDDGTGNQVLSVANRTGDYEGVETPAGLLEEGVEYTLSMRVRLAAGTAGPAGVRFVAKPAYTWLGNTSMSDTEWTTISVTYTPGADAATQTIYIGTDNLTGAYTYLVDDFSITRVADDTEPPYEPYTGVWDFETGTAEGWVARNSQGTPTVDATEDESHGGDYALAVTNRTGQGDGAGYDFADVFTAGQEYELSAWVKMLQGQPTDDVVLSIQTGESTFANIQTVAGVTADEWVHLTASYTFPGGDLALMYFESPWAGGDNGTNYSFLVDDISVTSVAPSEIEDLPAIFEEFAGQFPVGVAIDSRETVGAPAELTLRHFNQVTAENHMKVEAWYDADRNFRMHPEAIAVMDFAQENDLRVYGHVLLWHSQTPDWFFQDDDGAWLTDSAEDQQFLRDRLTQHVDDVAAAIADLYGPFGSDTNPLVAWDVVNEVVSDQASLDSDGLRTSRWYQVLGEDYIDLAFDLADEAFNETYAVDDSVVERPIALFINDYNTEQSGKQNRYYDLVERLLARGLPIDGVGHQFHVSLSMPVSALEGALARFADLPLVQAVTEMDVTVGESPTEALRIEQGYYYRDAFRVFRDYADDLYSVTIWGLSDNRSWRSTQAPLVFNSRLLAKPAYHGIMDGELVPRIRTSNVFAGDVALGAGATDDVAWRSLPLLAIEDAAQFQLRWAGDHLTAFVDVEDATDDDGDLIAFEYGEDQVAFGRDGSGDVDGVVTPRAGGYRAVVHLPGTFAQGDIVDFDVRVTDETADETVGWNSPGALGTLTLVEDLSFTEVIEAPAPPAIDGTVDDVWALADVVQTERQVTGSADGAASADVRTLWSGDGMTLYVLMDVTDDQLNADASNPWDQDSVEIYIDRGNAKNGSYRYDDSQIRIDFQGDVSFGTGDETFQANSIDFAVSTGGDGYVVEVAIDLLEAYGGPGTFHGMDFQVNDATDGVRTSIRNWADPTGTGYQSTAHWGVGKLVAAPVTESPAVTLGVDEVKAGGTVVATLSGFEPGETAQLYLSRTGLAALGGGLAAAPGEPLLGTAVMDAEGAARGTITIPAGTAPGDYFVNVELDGTVAASAALRVLAADPAAPGGTGGRLPRTGADVVGLALTALLLMGAGAALIASRRPTRKGAMA